MDCHRAGRDELGRASVENLGTGTRIGRRVPCSPQVKEEKAGQQRVGGGKKRDEKRRDRGGGWNSRVP